MKRYLFLMILIGMLIGLGGCGSAGDPVQTTESVGTDSASEKTEYADNLPVGLNYGGETVTFLYREEVANEFYVAEGTGEIVSDTQYDSMLAVEERLKVNIETVLRPGHMVEARGEYMNHITASAMAGDNAYDWVDMMAGNAPGKIAEDIFLDLSQNRYIDVSMPWYLKNMTEELAVDDRLYFVSGDASLGYLKSAFCLYFNASLAEDYRLGSLYALVDEGKWTMDKLNEISTAASQDLNNDGSWDENDALGFVVHDTNHSWGFLFSQKIKMYDKAAAEFIFGTERDAQAVEAMNKLFFRTEGAWYSGIANSRADHIEKYNKITDKFKFGEILIMTAEIDDAVAYLRNMEEDYGILPCPKLDEDQESYHTGSRGTHNVFSLLKTTEDADRAGAVMEALSASNYASVLPAYFETALKVKYSRDNDSARMFDLIRSVMTLDFGFVFSGAIGNPLSVVSRSYTNENSIASEVAANKERLDTELAAYLEMAAGLE